jgi:hypothetical protein
VRSHLDMLVHLRYIRFDHFRARGFARLRYFRAIILRHRRLPSGFTSEMLAFVCRIRD